MREEHAILDGITLPFDDKFWDEYYVPLGWNCRCQVVQVSKKRYEPSNPSEALARGRAATYKPNADGVNKAAMFRFNPGKEQRIFPKKHPYFPKGCGDCGLNQYAIGSQSPATCTACKDIYKMLRKRKKKEIVNDSNLYNKTFNIKEIRINNTLKFDKHSLKRYVGEAQSLDELNLVYEIYNGNVKFEFLRTEPIDMSKNNAKDKIKRKVRDYSVYRVKVNGMQYRLCIENYKDVYEQLYGIKTLKKGDDDYD